MKKGYFISFEGGEGAGKSTIIQEVKKQLERWGMSSIVTREPGGIKIAEEIRSVIVNVDHTMMDERTEALLYAAARRQHLTEKIIPLLNEGVTVLCDRFIDSSLAYQGYARGLGIDSVFEINRFAIDDCMPDLTIWMDLDPKEGLRRVHANSGREVNRLDLEDVSFHEKVRKGYQILHERFPERIHRVNAGQEIEKVSKEVCNVIQSWLDQRFFGRSPFWPSL